MFWGSKSHGAGMKREGGMNMPLVDDILKTLFASEEIKPPAVTTPTITEDDIRITPFDDSVSLVLKKETLNGGRIAKYQPEKEIFSVLWREQLRKLMNAGGSYFSQRMTGFGLLFPEEPNIRFG